MYFTSGTFLLFAAVLIALYYALPKRCQWPLLMVASLVFYAFSGLQNLIFLLSTAAVTYLSARRMDAILAAQKSEIAAHPDWTRDDKKACRAVYKRRRQRWLIFASLFCIAMLGTLKFTASAGIGILLPMGISFYTFQALGYVIDAFRATSPGFAEKNPAKHLLFVSFFPQLIQGPISRFDALHEQLFAQHRFNSDEFLSGLLRTAFGFFKKLIIADRLLVSVRISVAAPDNFRGIYTLLTILIYAVTLYADFTGGIDITIGIAQMLGIRLAENFNRPFFAKNISDYWRRWHITMGTWFRDYIFYPLSVSKTMLSLQRKLSGSISAAAASRIVVYIVTIVTWFATGIWHGVSANFIVWGLANGAVIIVSQELTPLYTRFRRQFPGTEKSRIYGAFEITRTFFLMCLLRSLDIYPTVAQTLRNLVSIFTAPNFAQLISRGITDLGLTAADFALAGAATSILIVAGAIVARRGENALGRTAKFGLALGLIALTLLFGHYGLGVDMRQFIYNQF